MISTITHAAASVLPALAAAATTVAAFGASAMRTKVAVIGSTSIDRQVVWFGTGLGNGTSYVPQSRGSTG